MAVIAAAEIGGARAAVGAALTACGNVEAFLPPSALLLHLRGPAAACQPALRGLWRKGIVLAAAPLPPRLRADAGAWRARAQARALARCAGSAVRTLAVVLAGGGGGTGRAAFAQHAALLAPLCPSCRLRWGAGGDAGSAVLVQAEGGACTEACGGDGPAAAEPGACTDCVPRAYADALAALPMVLWVAPHSAPRAANAYARLATLSPDLDSSPEIVREWGACGAQGSCALADLPPFSQLAAVFPELGSGGGGGGGGGVAPGGNVGGAASTNASARQAAMGRGTCDAACASPACGMGFATCAGVASPVSAAGLDGAGQLISVADTGLDTAHPMFFDPRQPVVTSRIARGPLPTSALHRKVAGVWAVMDGVDAVGGHGTHVAGTAAGASASAASADGALFSAMQGVAPSARLLMTDTACNTAGGCMPPGGLVVTCDLVVGGRCAQGAWAFPVAAQELFEPPYLAGARIMSNSWATANNRHSSYNAVSAALDAVAAHRPDMLLIFAASNGGADENGAVYAGISSEAAAKNVLAVGASLDGYRAHIAKIRGGGGGGGDLALPAAFGRTHPRSCSALVAANLPAGCPAQPAADCLRLAMASPARPAPPVAAPGSSGGWQPDMDLAFCCGCTPRRVLEAARAGNALGSALSAFLGQYSGRLAAPFSSRGPTLDGRIKPDVLAPGTDIVSARASGADPRLQPYGSFACPPDKITASSSGRRQQVDALFVGAGPSQPFNRVLAVAFFEATTVVAATVEVSSVASAGTLYLSLVALDTGSAQPPAVAQASAAVAARGGPQVAAFALGPAAVGPGNYSLLLAASAGAQFTAAASAAAGAGALAVPPPCFGAMSDALRVTLDTTRGDGAALLQPLSGTSMSAPHVAGLAALARQYFCDGFYPSGTSAGPGSGFAPSAAVLKAVLINAAAPLAVSDAETLLAPLRPAPAPPRTSLPEVRAEGGFGVVNLLRGLALAPAAAAGAARQPSLLLLGLTTAPAQPPAGADRLPPPGTALAGLDASVGDGGARVYCVDVVAAPTAWLSLTLVWTDPPGSPLAAFALVNDLDLEVRPPPAAPGAAAQVALLLGNNDAGAPLQQRDGRNNVEKVYLPAPRATLAAGGAQRLSRPYAVRVRGARVPWGPQQFALAVTGPGVALAPTGVSCADDGGAGGGAAAAALLVAALVVAAVSVAAWAVCGAWACLRCACKGGGGNGGVGACARGAAAARSAAAAAAALGSSLVGFPGSGWALVEGERELASGDAARADAGDAGEPRNEPRARAHEPRATGAPASREDVEVEMTALVAAPDATEAAPTGRDSGAQPTSQEGGASNGNGVAEATGERPCAVRSAERAQEDSREVESDAAADG